MSPAYSSEWSGPHLIRLGIGRVRDPLTGDRSVYNVAAEPHRARAVPTVDELRRLFADGVLQRVVSCEMRVKHPRMR
jgi:hypothetical protein